MSDPNMATGTTIGVRASPVLVVVRDLMAMSQIRGAAERLGVAVVFIREPEKLAASAGSEAWKIILDCNLPGAIEAVGGCLKAADNQGQTRETDVVGFASHTDVQTISAARSAGIKRVVARSAFFADIASFLA